MNSKDKTICIAYFCISNSIFLVNYKKLFPCYIRFLVLKTE